MNKYKLGKRSLGNIETCHKDLQLIAHESIKVTQVDFTVIEGARTEDRQQDLFNKGKSKVNPLKYTPEVLVTKGMHIVNEYRKLSDAFDFIAYVPNKPKLAFDVVHLLYLIGVFTSVAERLHQEGRISHHLRSGANWDMDGELKYDQTFFDAPHVELRK